MSRALVALLVLALAGCATATRWTPCPDGLTIGGSHQQGTLNGSDVVKALNAGEADGVDSNFSAWSVSAGLHMKLGYAPEECRTWGGEPPK